LHGPHLKSSRCSRVSELGDGCPDLLKCKCLRCPILGVAATAYRTQGRLLHRRAGHYYLDDRLAQGSWFIATASSVFKSAGFIYCSALWNLTPSIPSAVSGRLAR